MKNIIIASLLLLATTFQLKGQEDKAFIHENVEALWKSSSIFKTPESVHYCKKQNALFVSNINGKPLEKDGNGFISKLSPDGKLLKLEWVKGLHAPKGMGIYKERLFVTDIDRIAEIDIESGKIIQFYNVPDAKFLNDIAVDVSGRIFISDMQANTIYLLHNEVVEIWLEEQTLAGPNGLSILQDYLYIGTNDKIVRANTSTKMHSDYILNTGGIDGLTCLENDQFIYSDWSGNVYITTLGKETEKLLGTVPQKINAADFEYVPESKIIYVPTFYDNRVMAYKINY